MLRKFRKMMHPFILKKMPERRNFKLEIINEHPYISQNGIYVMNHSSKHDAPIACEAIKKHFYVLVGKQRLELIDKAFFWLNGIVYIDRKDKQSKKRGFRKMLEILKAGDNILTYPEGTWNMTPSKPLIPLSWGIIELAQKAEVPIIPLVAEYHPDSCYVKFGEQIYVDAEMSKKEGIEQVEDALATLKWDIWELFPVAKRTEQMKEEFESMIQKRIDDYPKLNLEYEKSVIRKREDAPENVLILRNNIF